MKNFKCLFVLLLVHAQLFAQNGTFTGKIISSSNNQTLVGVSVMNTAKKINVVTDIEGKFSISLAPGKYEFLFSLVGFQTKRIDEITIQPNQVFELNIVLEEANKELTEVVVTASSARKESAAAVLSLQKNNLSVSDGISIETIKKSPDNNVGEVLKRVTGTAVQDEKFVIVRGLNDRYNVATINGAVMPSTEPDRRSFSFDIVPSNMIDNVLINKTATPDMPGEFSGGIVQITTKDIPYKNAFGLAFGSSFNTISTGRNFNIGYMGKLDYLGFDDGNRLFPNYFYSTRKWRTLDIDQKIEASKRFQNTYGDRTNQTAMPGMNAQFHFSQKFSTKNGATWGLIGALNYRNQQSIQQTARKQYNDATSLNNILFDYNDSTYNFSTNVGALLNIGYKKGRNKFMVKNLFNRVFENTQTIRSGYNYNDLQYVDKNRIGINLIKTIASSQFEGEHAVGENNNKLKWNLNYAFTKKDQPDYRVQPYQKSLSDASDKSVPVTIALRNTYRFWSELDEHTFGGKIDFTKRLNWNNSNATFKAGTLTQYKQRNFNARAFRYEQASSSNFDQSLLALPVNQIFDAAQMKSTGFYLNEITNNTDKYDANALLTGSYAMLENQLDNRWKLIWGARVETFNYIVETGNVSGAKELIKRNYLDVLPSVNVIYSFDRKSNLRFAASRTVSRPDFREVANFSYFDLVRGAIVRGNNALERSQNTNLDLRFETYPSSGEIISATVFFKHFKKPIEQRLSGESTFEYQVITYFNPASAMAYGIELDFRKKLNFIHSGIFWENLTISTNASLIQSSVNLNGANSNSYDINRPMQGQSPYLINVGINYSDPVRNWSSSILFNRVGQRIETVGAVGLPDVYENGRSILDFQIAKKFNKEKAEIKFNISNMLNSKQIFYTNVEGKKSERKYQYNQDRVQWSNLLGINVGLGFAYHFN